MEMRTCQIEGCGKPVHLRGWCKAHYRRWRRHGDPTGGGPSRAPRGAPMAFLEKAAATSSNECIEWPFSRDHCGYGAISHNGKLRRAHRVVLEMFLGRPIAEGMEVAHAPIICHNPACVNPHHLREARRLDNARDRIVDGTSVRGVRHHKSKLTEDDVISIRSDGRTQQVIALEFGVSPGLVSQIKSGAVWGWLADRPTTPTHEGELR